MFTLQTNLSQVGILSIVLYLSKIKADSDGILYGLNQTSYPSKNCKRLVFVLEDRRYKYSKKFHLHYSKIRLGKDKVLAGSSFQF